MLFRPDRRRFLQAGAGSGALAGLGDLSFLSTLNPVSAAEASAASSDVQLRPEIEPVVRLIEETPRERLLEDVAARIRGGLSYREVLAGLLLAGVKNVEPRPSVGFKFHAVLVVNSAHLASLASPPEYRWLPIFWALDYYKNAAARDVRERGDWTMSRVSDASLPAAHNAHAAFAESMENWDEQAADSAIAQLARTAGAMRRTRCSSATEPATSVRSGIRQSTWRTATGRCSASAGNMPSRFCVHSPTLC